MRSILTIILTLFVAISVVAQDDKIAAQKRIIANLERQVADGEKRVTSLRKDRATKERQVASLAEQIEARGRLLEAQNEQVRLLRGEISQNSKRLSELNAELEGERKLYAEMVREAYRNYRNNNLMSYLFTSENFTDVARKIVNLRAISQYRESRMAKIDSLAAITQEQGQQLIAQRATLEEAVARLQAQRTKLQADQQAARGSIKKMSTQEKRILQERELQRRKLDSAISELRKLASQNRTGASFSAKTTNLNLPVVGGRVKRYMDNMAEIVGSAGAQVNSIYEGKVVDVKYNRITGKYDVYIAHGGYITSYAGLASVSVEKSNDVVKNQAIGVVGQAVDILTMQTEHKIVFGIYPPNPAQKLRAADCFKK